MVAHGTRRRPALDSARGGSPRENRVARFALPGAARCAPEPPTAHRERHRWPARATLACPGTRPSTAPPRARSSALIHLAAAAGAAATVARATPERLSTPARRG